MTRDDMEKAVQAGMERMRPIWEMDAIVLAERMDECRECAQLVIKLDRLGLSATQIAAAIRAKYQ
jgi:hypothetical protein